KPDSMGCAQCPEPVRWSCSQTPVRNSGNATPTRSSMLRTKSVGTLRRPITRLDDILCSARVAPPQGHLSRSCSLHGSLIVREPRAGGPDCECRVLGAGARAAGVELRLGAPARGRRALLGRLGGARPRCARPPSALGVAGGVPQRPSDG